jgi:aspartyl protease
MPLRWTIILIALLSAGAAGAAKAGSLALATIPYKAVGSTILLPVGINGGDPGWFMLDSGANSCALDQAFAARHGLRPAGNGSGTGAGAGPVPYVRYDRAVRFTLHQLEFACPDSHVIGLDLGGQPAIIGARVDGIIGTDFFERYVVETDYARQVVRLYDPGTFRYAGSGCRIPMTFDRRLPHVKAHLIVDGRRGADRVLLVDSGSQSAVDDAWMNQSRSLRTGIAGVGLGQTFATRVGRFSTVRIGCFAVADVPGSAEGVPLVGGEVLRHFTAIYDWRRAQLILEPSAGYARSLADSGVAGLDLKGGEDASAVVDFVGSRTAAERAGLMAGDVLSSIDGTAVQAFDFSQLGGLFRRGRIYRLEIVRGTTRRTLLLAP